MSAENQSALVNRLSRSALLVLSWMIALAATVDKAAPAEPQLVQPVGYLIVTVPNPITDASRKALEDKIERARNARGEKLKTVVFDFNPGDAEAATSDFNACLDLARLIQKLNGAGITTVAFVHAKTTRHTVLAVLACKDVVMTNDGQIGMVADGTKAVLEAHAAEYARLAGREREAVVLKMLDKDIEVIRGFEKGRAILVDAAKAGKEGTPFANVVVRPDPSRIDVVMRRGELSLYSMERAIGLGLCTAGVNSPAHVLRKYGLKPVWDGAPIPAVPPLPERAAARLGDYQEQDAPYPVNDFEKYPGYFGLAFSPDSKRLATGLLQIWDVDTKRLICTLDSYHPEMKDVATRGRSHLASILGVRFLSDDELVAWCGNRTVMHWKISAGRAPRVVLKGFDENLPPRTAVAVSGDGRLIAATGLIKNFASGLVVKELSSPGEVARLELGDDVENHYPMSCAFTPDGGRLVIGDSTGKGAGKLFLWDTATARRLGILSTIRHAQGGVGSLVVTGDGRYVISASFEDYRSRGTTNPSLPPIAVRITELASGREVAAFSGTEPIAVSPDGRLLAHGSEDIFDKKKICIVDLHTMKEVARVQHETGFVASLVFSPDGKWLASSGNSATALLWKTEQFYQELKAEELSIAEIDSWWAALDQDAKLAQIAIQKLSRSPKGAVPFISGKLRFKPGQQYLFDQYEQRVRQLEAKEFKTREFALKELMEAGAYAAPYWLKLLDQKPSEDARERIEKLKKEFCHPGGAFVTSPLTLRHLRAIEVLERIGTPEARKVLDEFAKFDARTFEGRDARAALERLAKKAK